MRRQAIIVAAVIILAAAVPAGIATAAAGAAQAGAQIPESVVTALVGGAFGFLASWLSHRRSAKKDDLDALRAILDELRAEREITRTDYRQVLAELEQERKKRRELSGRVDKYEADCAEKDTRLEGLRCEVELLRTEIQGRDQRIADLVTEVDELRAIMEQNGLTPPPRRSRK